MDIKFENLYGQGGKWYKVIVDGAVVGEIMQMMHSLNRVNGWTFKHISDKPTTMHRTYSNYRDATKALVSFKKGG